MSVGVSARVCRALPVVTLGMLALWVSPARAVDKDAQVWVPITARIKLADRWKLYLEGQQRMGGNGMRQEVIRSAIGYYLKPYWGLYLGYGWNPSFNDFRNENRVYQESLFDQHFGDLRLINRTRLEQRFIEDAQGVAIRLRHMIKVLYPLEHTHHLFFSAYDEPFADLNNVTNGPRAGFDQNRAYVGFRYQVTHAVGVELAYMNQFQNKTTEDISSNNAVVSLDFSL